MKITDIEVTYKNHMGNDLTVVNAARVSFDKESELEPVFSKYPTQDYITPDKSEDVYKIIDYKLSDRDKKLIGYLAKHDHWTPFGHVQAQFRIKAPIFIARQLVKHQIGLVWNEVSRRYVDHEPEFWFPKVWKERVKNKKQGAGDALGEKESHYATSVLYYNTAQCYENYLKLLDNNVAPEQARIVLPLNSMTEWYWTGSLAAFARVCRLRLSPDAQSDTSEVAKGISEHMSKLAEHSWKGLMGNG